MSMISRHPGIRRLSCAAALLLCATLPAASTSAQTGSPRTSERTPRRWAADSFWTRTWFRGAAKDPELFTEPRQVVVAGDLVVVLDLGLREVSAFDASTGATRLQLAARGEGPGEFRRPAQLAAALGGFAVLDHATSRLSVFDARGRFTWDTPILNAGGAEGLCVQRDGRIVVKHPGSKDALMTFDSTGRTISKRSLPWPDPGIKPAAMSAFVAGPDALGNCMFARRFGSEWLLVRSDGKLARLPYVSQHPEATVAVKTGPKKRIGDEATFTRTEFTSNDAAVSSVMLLGDTMIVRGGPAERDGYRILDYYLLPSGRYVHSRRLPSVFIATAVAPGGAFFGTTINEESGALVAFRATANKPAPRPAAPPAELPAAVRQPGN